LIFGLFEELYYAYGVFSIGPVLVDKVELNPEVLILQPDWLTATTFILGVAKAFYYFLIRILQLQTMGQNVWIVTLITC
jgi:hypothetical protein